MRPVAITGIGCVGAAGAGVAPFAAALEEHLGGTARPAPSERVETIRGQARELKLSRIAPFDRERYLPSRKLRRMGELSQVWVIATMLALEDAARPTPDPCPPDRRGTYLGTGFGCTQTTWEYLDGMLRDGAGMANPFQFSESVANAPAGHSAIELDTRGASVTLTCGDASAAASVSLAARAIRDDRIDMAWCGGVEMFSEPLLRILATVGTSGHLGEGCVCFLLEALDSARGRGARIYAEVAADTTASDPSAGAAEWTCDQTLIASTMRRAATGAEARTVFLHAPGSPAADQAERRAAADVCPQARLFETTSMSGSLSAAGGFNLAAAALHVSRRSAPLTLVNASSWGGSLFTIALRPV